MDDLTGFRRDLLLIIAGLNEPKGLDICEELEKYYGTEIRHGRLYPNLDTLAENGLVAKGRHDLRTNKYELTDQGKDELKARLRWKLSYIPDELKAGLTDSTPEEQTQ